MSELQGHTDEEAEKVQDALFARADLACAFGPSFFLGHLGRFVRDRCPDPKDNLSEVQLHLADGETLHLCHIIGVSPRWVVLAVHDATSRGDGMAIELVPYEIIRRVCIRTRRAAEGAAPGYAQTRPPEVVAAETWLQAAMPPYHAGGD